MPGLVEQRQLEYGEVDELAVKSAVGDGAPVKPLADGEANPAGAGAIGRRRPTGISSPM
jgi:hypothetical protein